MKTSTNTILVIALVVVMGLFLFSGFGAMTGAMMNGGFMGTGWGGGMTPALAPGASMGSVMMGGISWMWIPTLLTLGVGLLIGWALFGKK